MDYTITSIAPIVLLPFLAFAINAFIVKRFTKAAVAISCGAIIGSFLFASRVFSDFVFGKYASDYHIHKVFNWFDLSFGDKIFKVDMGIYIDNMTAVMLFMVTGVASLIHIFSTYYMKDDARYGRFFVYVSLFTSAMLGLVLSDNLLSVFIFWEIMGFCSYSLIGFYYEKEKAGSASMKAFMTTRVGDVFFLLGILAIWSVVGNVTFVDIYKAIDAGAFTGLTALGVALPTFAGICIFLGTIGKSAQFPLQVWLPDAMMGPTPCSALIHAATMVAAGVYLSLRAYPLMELGGLLPFIAYIGAITAFGAATIALIQTDLKAVLAYSTISQLGYMVMGIGVEAYNASFMHLITHAVFKACLFLAAGAVIHSLHCHKTHEHVKEMPRMGGLKNKMKFTWIAMWACTLAIAGVPFFSGFVSKDRILGEALIQALANPFYIPVAILGFVAAGMTAFYMCRMMFLTFHGEPRDKELYDHTKVEKLKWNKNVPLLILSVFTLGVFFSGSLTGQKIVKVAGEKIEWFDTLIQKPKLETFKNYQKEPFGFVDNNIEKTFTQSSYDPNHGMNDEDAHHAHMVHYAGAALSIVIAFLGIFLAFLMYVRKAINPANFVAKFQGWYKALQNKYYFDDFYIGKVIGKGLLPLNNVLSKFDMSYFDKYAVDGWEKVNEKLYKVSDWFDNKAVDRAVDANGLAVRLFNVILRSLQSGKVQSYFVVIAIILIGYLVKLL